MRRNHKAQIAAVVINILLSTVSLKASFGQDFQAERIVAENDMEGGAEMTLPDAPSTSAMALEYTAPILRENNAAEAASPSVLSTPLPATADERLHRFLENSLSQAALGGDLLDAVQAHYGKSWPGYGKGLTGFERRYFAVTARHVSNNFFETYLFPTLLHQNPRSPRLGTGSVWHRFGYAVSRVALTYSDDGRQTFNSSLLLSVVATNAVANFYYPENQRGFSATLNRIQSSLIDNVQGNLSREFLPDVERFLWKHAPSSIHRLAERLPLARKWQPAFVSVGDDAVRP